MGSSKAFTIKYQGKANRIVSGIGITPLFDTREFNGEKLPYPILNTRALWDTGSTRSVLTSQTVKDLGLTPVGMVTVNHAGGTNRSNTYLVNVFLPNRVILSGIQVSECIDSDFGAIIGMDIITLGDFSITNAGKRTWMSFMIPSGGHIDFSVDSPQPKI